VKHDPQHKNCLALHIAVYLLLDVVSFPVENPDPSIAAIA
jgi:hypothetical protein